MTWARTSLCLNNCSSQGKPKEQSEGQKLCLPWAEGLLEPVVCSAHSSAILALWNALPPPDLGTGMWPGWSSKAGGVFLFFFTALRSKVLFGKAAWSRFRGFTLSRAIPQLFPCLWFYKEWIFSWAAPVAKALPSALKGCGCSSCQVRTFERGHSSCCQHSSPCQGFQRHPELSKLRRHMFE